MTMRGHNDNDDNKAPQTGRTTSANAVEPCLKIKNQPYSRQQQWMLDNDDNGGNR
jgi:hypothetical protein